MAYNSPPKRRRRATSGVAAVRPIYLFVILLSLTLLLLIAAGTLQAISSTLSNANALGRLCAPPIQSGSSTIRPRISMVSLSDERGGGRRSFRGVMAVAAANKRAYAASKGYDFVDGSELIDRSRPTSWSKIKAVKAQLRKNYGWVFWNDADTLVLNPNISLENVIAAAVGHSNFSSSPDLIVTKDYNGINAGVFLVRRSRWSEDFLDKWWNQTSFIRFGSTKSGDNDALKHIISALPREEYRDHVVVATQCLFNSYPWSPTLTSFYRFASSPQIIWNGVYSSGDFIVHLAGVDNKKRWLDQIIAREISRKT